MNASSQYLVERYAGYILLDRIGQGGMAEVFRAVVQGAAGFRRLCVVKRILPQYCQDPDFVEMFVAEARLCALLHHPNIVHVIEFGKEDGAYYLVMEYLHGPTVLRVLRALARTRASFPPAMAAHVAREVAVGLDYAHRLRDEQGRPRNIVHRDVSPSNVILPLTGGVKIVDFGIAKAENEARAVETAAGVVKGKFAYTAPEQVTGRPVDHRADVFSLGVMLWEMLTARRLFHGENEFQTINLLLDKPVPAPSTLRPGITPDLDVIVLRALERERSRRYPTAEAMAADLESYLHAARYRAADLPRMLVSLCGAELPPGAENAIPPEVLERVKALERTLSGSVPTAIGLLEEPITAPDPPPGAASEAPTRPGPPARPGAASPPRRWLARRSLLASVSAGLAAGFIFVVQPGESRTPTPPPPPARAETAPVTVPTATAVMPDTDAQSIEAVVIEASPIEAPPPAAPKRRASRRSHTPRAAVAATSTVHDAIPTDPFSER